MPYKNKERQRQAQRNHYNKNKSNYKNARCKNRNLRDEWFSSLKISKCCSDCGESDYRCLDFHHINPETKLFSINEGVKNGYSEVVILSEIAKCEVLCANCHRKLHTCYKEEYSRPNVQVSALWVREYKSTLSCKNCNITGSVVLDFHHIDENDKWLPVSAMVGNGCSVKRLKKEIAKCEVLCANCHRKLHNGNKWSKNCYGDMV